MLVGKHFTQIVQFILVDGRCVHENILLLFFLSFNLDALIFSFVVGIVFTICTSSGTIHWCISNSILFFYRVLTFLSFEIWLCYWSHHYNYLFLYDMKNFIYSFKHDDDVHCFYFYDDDDFFLHL